MVKERFIMYKPKDTFRFWCQKTLPLVYDDSLSYYELLCKVVNYLNTTIEDVNMLGTEFVELQKTVEDYFSDLNVQDEVNKKLDEMVEDGTLESIVVRYFKYKTYYNALDYGIVGDDSTDNKEKIQELINRVKQDGGGTIYFPAGKYRFSDTIYIPSYISILGDGYSTVLYGVTPNPYLRCYIAVCGSHIVIDNIHIEYVDGMRNFTDTIADIVGIKVINNTYNSLINGQYNVYEDHFNIDLINLYSTTSYFIEVENHKSPTIAYTIQGVTISNCWGEASVISLKSNSNLGINYCAMSDLNCGLLRAVGEKTGSVNISNCSSNFGIFSIKGAKLTNCQFKISPGSRVLNWDLYRYVLYLDGCYATNINVDASNLSEFDCVYLARNKSIISGLIADNCGNGKLVLRDATQAALSGSNQLSNAVLDGNYTYYGIENLVLAGADSAGNPYSNSALPINAHKVKFHFINGVAPQGYDGQRKGNEVSTDLSYKDGVYNLKAFLYLKANIWSEKLSFMQIDSAGLKPPQQLKSLCMIRNVDSGNISFATVSIETDGLLRLTSPYGLPANATYQVFIDTSFERNV